MGQRSGEGPGPEAILGGKVDVATAQSQPVRLPYQGAPHHFHGDVQVPDHAANDLELLKVLFAEVGPLGLDDVKELEHHGTDPPEVPRPRRAAQVGAKPGFFHEGGGVGGVHGRGVGGEDQVGFQTLQKVLVPDQIPGVGGQVLPGAELEGVDEDGYHRRGVFSSAAPHQGQVPFVEKSHGGHQPHRFWHGRQGLSRRSGRGDDAHNSKPPELSSFVARKMPDKGNTGGGAVKPKDASSFGSITPARQTRNWGRFRPGPPERRSSFPIRSARFLSCV